MCRWGSLSLLFGSGFRSIFSVLYNTLLFFIKVMRICNQIRVRIQLFTLMRIRLPKIIQIQDTKQKRLYVQRALEDDQRAEKKAAQTLLSHDEEMFYEEYKCVLNARCFRINEKPNQDLNHSICQSHANLLSQCHDDVAQVGEWFVDCLRLGESLTLATRVLPQDTILKGGLSHLLYLLYLLRLMPFCFGLIPTGLNVKLLAGCVIKSAHILHAP